MGVVEENNYLKSVEGNIKRIKVLKNNADKLSETISSGKSNNLDEDMRQEFGIYMEINSLYRDTAAILDMITSEENVFKANRFYKELQEYKPLTIG